MTKKQIDNYFTENWIEIQKAIKSNSTKCVTANVTDISSEIYLICIEKAEKIQNIAGFIRILASNIYRWKDSKFNQSNKILANEINIQLHNEVEILTIDEQMQNRFFCLEKYKNEAKQHELIFYDIFVNKKITTVRGISKEINITQHAASVMIREFKQKIKNHERKTKNF